jgi:hypothetical protein
MEETGNSFRGTSNSGLQFKNHIRDMKKNSMTSMSIYDNNFLRTQNSPLGQYNEVIFKNIKECRNNRYRFNSTAMDLNLPTETARNDNSNPSTQRPRHTKSRNEHRQFNTSMNIIERGMPLGSNRHSIDIPPNETPKLKLSVNMDNDSKLADSL